MQVGSLRESLLERRQQQHNTGQLWDKLSLTQKFATSTLTQSGYEMAFLRSSQAGNLAVLISDDSTATISAEGEINTNPNICLR